MKRIFIILILLFSILLLNASQPNRNYPSFEEELSKVKTLFDGLIHVEIEFSQEEYGYGDTVNVVVHFEVDTEKNVENLKFAVSDPVLAGLYNLPYLLHTVTRERIEQVYKSYNKDHPGVEAIVRDHDLILSNDNPRGDYPLRYGIFVKIERKILGPDGRLYPYYFETLDIYSFTESIHYENITEYPGKKEMIRIPVKLNSSAYLTEEEIQQNINKHNLKKTEKNESKNNIDHGYINPNSLRPGASVNLLSGSTFDIVLADWDAPPALEIVDIYNFWQDYITVGYTILHVNVPEVEVD
ncbi:MAG: hypothetical protein P9M05_07315, partial [Candidatus Stygibacter australis]|nr:hypothetical protein [Candidatus Stygibacter australis]